MSASSPMPGLIVSQALARFFIALKPVMKPMSELVIDVANTRTPGEITPVAWELALLLSKEYCLHGEEPRVVEPAKTAYGLVRYSYVLTFSRD